MFSTLQTEITVTLTLANTANANDVVPKTFRIRRPPIVLVHGYNSSGATWGSDFLNALAAATPSDFIRPISYGTEGEPLFNTWASFDALVPELDRILSLEEVILTPTGRSRDTMSWLTAKEEY